MTKKITTPAALIQAFLTHYYETTDKTRLAEDWGIKMGKKGDGFQFGTSYFYETQNTTMPKFKLFQEFAAERGFTVTPFNDYRGQLKFERKKWPAQSFATIQFTILRLG